MGSAIAPTPIDAHGHSGMGVGGYMRPPLMTLTLPDSDVKVIW